MTDQFTLKRRVFLLKHTSSKMIRKIFRLKSGHNLLLAHESKYYLGTPSHCVTCETPINEHHLLFECKKLQLLQTNLKAIISNTLSFHYHNSPSIGLEPLLGEGDTCLEAALEITCFLCEFLNLPNIQDIEY